jgi:hypothetical protein
MWISKAIKKEQDTKPTFREIEKLIKFYSDPTNIDWTDKFWIIDIGHFLKPRTIRFFILLCLFTITNMILFLFFDILKFSVLENWTRLCISISGPILILGITFANVAKTLSEQSRFASDYLNDSCKMYVFACIVFGTILTGLLSIILYPIIETPDQVGILYIILRITFLLYSSFTLAGTIWSLTALLYITLQITRCMHPENSIRAASSYAARTLGRAFLIEVHNAAWMGKYNDILNERLKGLKRIHASEGYWAARILPRGKDKDNGSTKTVCEINLPEKIDFHLGYRDYNLSKLKKINNLLEKENAELYLTPHATNNREFGLLSGPTHKKLSTKIQKNIRMIYRFHKDRYIESTEEFWEGSYFRLRNSFLKAAQNADISQFRAYLRSIEELYDILRKARKSDLVRKYSVFDYKKTRYLYLYSQSVRWILENSRIEADIKEAFLDALVDSIWQQAEDEIKNGDCFALDVFTWLIPKTYQLFEEIVKDKSSRLWELRGRIGGFYAHASSLLSNSEYDIDKRKRIQIQLTLHKGIIKWLLPAIESQDHELVKSLCKAARQIVFPNEKIIFTPPKLVTQHFILCGKMIEFLMENKSGVLPLFFKLLFVDEHTYQEHSYINFDELRRFFIESKQTDLSTFRFEFSSTDWEIDPLIGGGHGTPNFTFQGNIELDYMFIYLSLSSIFLLAQENPKPIPFEFWGYNLPEKINKFAGISTQLEMYDFANSKERFVGWLNSCDQLYEQQKEEQIANAPLNEGLKKEYKDGFWEGYKRSKTFFSFCLSKRYCLISTDNGPKKGYIFPRELFIDGNRTTLNGIAKSHGGEISSFHDNKLLKELMASEPKTETGNANSIIEQLDQACEWLIKQKTNKENGFILFFGNVFIESELYKSDCYERSDNTFVFSGYYKNCPIITLYDANTTPTCIAFDLQGWKGLKIKREITEQDIWGQMEIRERTEVEISELIRSGKIKSKNKAKGQCIIEYEMFWTLDKNSLPQKKIIYLNPSPPPPPIPA